MTFRIQQISDYGTGHPAVARLQLQMSELMKFYPISKENQDSIFAILHSEVLPKLMICFRTHERIHSDIENANSKIITAGLDFQSNGRAYVIPHISSLKSDAETYLYNAKSALRDFTIIFNILFNTKFKRVARYDKILKWAKNHFGEDDSLTKMIEEDLQIWIKRLIDMRNAVEHPGEHSGILHIHDFRSTEVFNEIMISAPAWQLNEDKPTSIDFEMDVFNSNMLTFFEESLLLCLEKFQKPPFLILSEIPEAKRRPECPVRFEMVLRTTIQTEQDPSPSP